jgi:hypothetical protein
MKKIVVLIVLAIIVICPCAAQSTSNDAQRIVGTWTQVNDTLLLFPAGTVWVFNANGTGTCAGENFYYGISASGGINIISYGNDDLTIWDLLGDNELFISPDGRRIIIYGCVLQKG